jgi:putative ABC transport system ATP-binding protein
MGCILRATSGSVRVAGKEVASSSERELPEIRLKNIGFVFQGFNLFPTLTVGENIGLALDLKGIRGKQAKQDTRTLLEQLGLADKHDRFPADLSGGQKQRVAIARALAGSPSVILADEPTAALDSHAGRNVMEMMRDLARKHGRGVVVVTHDSRVLEFGDRVVHMEDGRIAAPLQRAEGTEDFSPRCSERGPHHMPVSRLAGWEAEPWVSCAAQ